MGKKIKTTVDISATGYWNGDVKIDPIVETAVESGYIENINISKEEKEKLGENPDWYGAESVSFSFESRTDARKFISECVEHDQDKRVCEFKMDDGTLCIDITYYGDSSPYGRDDPWSDLRDDSGRFYLGDGVYV